MKLIIISPFYYLGKDLSEMVKNTDGEIMFIVTDNVSPIFPVERRIEWLERTYFVKGATYESIIQNDESEEIIAPINKLIKEFTNNRKEEHKVVWFLTEDHNKAIDVLGDVEWHTMHNPAAADLEDVDAVFSARFLNEFTKYVMPKDKTLPEHEIHYIIPFFKNEDKIYYGFFENYGSDDNPGLLGVQLGYKDKVDEVEIGIRYGASAMFYAKTIKSPSLVGWLDSNYWTVEIEKPSYIDFSSEYGLRYMVSDKEDIIFIDEDYLLKMDVPLMHWLSNKIKEERAEKARALDDK